MSFPPQAMPWWRSRVIVGAVISIIMKLLVVSGLTGEVSPADSQQIIDLVLTLIGVVGDLVAIGSRVRQKHAPAITAGGVPKGRGLSLVLACLLIIPLSGCGLQMTTPPPSPSALADRTKVDEQAALTVTLAYTAASKIAALAIETGLVDDPATINRIGYLDDKAYQAVNTVERAYRAGNADNYADALREANEAVAKLLAAPSGETQ